MEKAVTRSNGKNQIPVTAQNFGVVVLFELL